MPWPLSVDVGVTSDNAALFISSQNKIGACGNNRIQRRQTAGNKDCDITEGFSCYNHREVITTRDQINAVHLRGIS